MPQFYELKDRWPAYMDAVSAAGGIPFMFPLTAEPEDLAVLVGLCDGLLFTGGEDVDPAMYHAEKSDKCGALSPERDAAETAVFSLAQQQDKPMIGICRGSQIINVLLGGTLYQDLPAEHPSEIAHFQCPDDEGPTHTVTALPDTPLRRLAGAETIHVNSFHHQAVKTLGSGLVPMAEAPDGLTEAFYHPGKRFLAGLQWHPEMTVSEDAVSLKLFQAFVEACGSRS